MGQNGDLGDALFRIAVQESLEEKERLDLERAIQASETPLERAQREKNERFEKERAEVEKKFPFYYQQQVEKHHHERAEMQKDKHEALVTLRRTYEQEAKRKRENTAEEMSKQKNLYEKRFEEIQDAMSSQERKHMEEMSSAENMWMEQRKLMETQHKDEIGAITKTLLDEQKLSASREELVKAHARQLNQNEEELKHLRNRVEELDEALKIEKERGRRETIELHTELRNREKEVNQEKLSMLKSHQSTVHGLNQSLLQEKDQKFAIMHGALQHTSSIMLQQGQANLAVVEAYQAEKEQLRLLEMRDKIQTNLSKMRDVLVKLQSFQESKKESEIKTSFLWNLFGSTAAVDEDAAKEFVDVLNSVMRDVFARIEEFITEARISGRAGAEECEKLSNRETPFKRTFGQLTVQKWKTDQSDFDAMNYQIDILEASLRKINIIASASVTEILASQEQFTLPQLYIAIGDASDVQAITADNLK